MEMNLTHADEITLSIDRDGLRQVLWNLFENARKYARDGKRIDVSLTSDARSAVIRVRDFGPGVDRDERQRIFERFVRSRHQKDGSVPGAGLGLAIARSIAEAHDGTISLEDVDCGASFVVRLPRTTHTSANS